MSPIFELISLHCYNKLIILAITVQCEGVCQLSLFVCVDDFDSGLFFYLCLLVGHTFEPYSSCILLVSLSFSYSSLTSGSVASYHISPLTLHFLWWDGSVAATKFACRRL